MIQVLQGYRNDLLSEGGEEGARQRIEKWLNPENSSMSWLVSDRFFPHFQTNHHVYASLCLLTRKLTNRSLCRCIIMQIGPDTSHGIIFGHILSASLSCSYTAFRWTRTYRESHRSPFSLSQPFPNLRPTFPMPRYLSPRPTIRRKLSGNV